ncbi:MAG: trypsin-like peptidase domain-containing protein [Anaerolineaceae bacterium]|jgi:2-alkenal reductase
MKKSLLVVVIVLILGVLVSCQFLPDINFKATTAPTQGSLPNLQATLAPQVIVNAEDIANTDLILTTLYDRVNPGVVTIISYTSQGEGSGSGFVYDYDGHIITNYHVVENAQTIEVAFASGLKVYATLVATDIDSDIAVIKVDVERAELVPLPLGDSDALKVGQMVVAIGNPYRLTSTLTLGVVSAKGRILDSLRTTEDMTSYTAGDLIQTDAAINPGNSGGPLLNLAGEVVGINRAIYTSGTTIEGEAVNSGIGYAISINIVKRVVPYLISDGNFDYPLMGISSTSTDLTLGQWQQISDTVTSGIYVMSVTAGGPASQAGLVGGSQPTNIQGFYKGGDIITAVDGIPVKVYGDLISYIFKNKSPGDVITLTILRNDKQQEVELTLGSR